MSQASWISLDNAKPLRTSQNASRAPVLTRTSRKAEEGSKTKKHFPIKRQEHASTCNHRASPLQVNSAVNRYGGTYRVVVLEHTYIQLRCLSIHPVLQGKRHQSIRAVETTGCVPYVPATSTVARSSPPLPSSSFSSSEVSGRATEIVLAAVLKAAVAIVPKVSLVCTSHTRSVVSDLSVHHV